MWDLSTPEAMKALASRLAPFVSPVDFIALYGDLGAGKTTFVQGLLPALGIVETVTSPTYQLVHSYAGPRQTIYHCDFYRIEPGEDEEIGLSEICSAGAVLVEWPGSIRRLPPDRLDVRIEGEGGSRRVSLAGFGAWQRKLARFREIEAFLDANGWDGAQCLAIRGDASARLFSRLQRGAKVIMLMDWPPVSDGPPIRDGRPYCQIAHLARKGAPFIAVSDWLRLKAGLSAPAVAAFDLDSGLFLIEDLGDAVFGALIAEGEQLDPLYALAVDGLLAIRWRMARLTGFRSSTARRWRSSWTCSRSGISSCFRRMGRPRRFLAHFSKRGRPFSIGLASRRRTSSSGIIIRPTSSCARSEAVCGGLA